VGRGGRVPRALYARAAELGLLGLGYPEELGGTPAPYALRLVMWRALCRFGTSGGVQACCRTTSACRRWWRWPLTPSGASAAGAGGPADRRAGHHRARWRLGRGGGAHHGAARGRRVRGRWREDLHHVGHARRLDHGGGAHGRGGHQGSGGLSLLLVPGDSRGLSRTRLDKMGWLCSDTAQLRFDGVRVPARYLLGEEGAGFKAIMANFNGERLGIAAGALGFAEACYDEALAWARQRKTFGQRLTEHQVIRHRLVDMQQRIRATAAWLEQLAARADAGDTGADWVAEVCTLKNQATQTMQFCADAGVQILGGMGYMRGTVCERIYREVKVITIGGGTEEIMKELAARQWGL
jgi:acyl-CoA dehydrogenase